MFWFIYFFIVVPLACAVFAFISFVDSRIRYDITIDGESIKGCLCEFHDRHGYLELTNPETKRVIIVRYKNYSVDRAYFYKKHRKEEE